jgi:hypothetical protein
MTELNGKIAAQLVADPLHVAIMLSNEELEEVIAAFVAVLNQRKKQQTR